MTRKALAAPGGGASRDAKPALATGQTPALPTASDDDPFLPDGEWNREVASGIAAELGLELSDSHWNLVALVRDQYVKSGSTPNIRKITGLSGSTTREIYTLFPRAPGLTLARVAGVPKPTSCL